MSTETKYRLVCMTGPNEGYHVGSVFPSEQAAKDYALKHKDSEDQEYKIQSIVTTITTLDVFTVPAHVPSLEEIADDIAAYSDGAFHIAWTEAFDHLSEADKETVRRMVYEQIESCEHCGWNFSIESLEEIEGEGSLCSACATDYYNSQEEEQDEDG